MLEISVSSVLDKGLACKLTLRDERGGVDCRDARVIISLRLLFNSLRLRRLFQLEKKCIFVL